MFISPSLIHIFFIFYIFVVIVRDADNLKKYQEKCTELTKTIEALKNEFQRQFQSNYERLMEDMRKKVKLAVGKEKKRADAYKEKAIEAHNRLKDTLDSV